MCPAPALAQSAGLRDSRRSDQRLHRRYPITLEIEYRLLDKGRVERLGFGKTLNVSGGGLLFQANESLPVGSPIVIMMNWPFMLDGVCPLKLVIHGHVVRSDRKGVAVRSKQHEFRTAGIRSSRSLSSSSKVPSLMTLPARQPSRSRSARR